MRRMITDTCAELEIGRAIHWFYTPMMLPLADGLSATLTVYDCMDELANFAFAPPEMKQREAELMARADVVFTRGLALHEAKRSLHPNVHAVPSSVDTPFFAQARGLQTSPRELAWVPHPRAGYCGVLDERVDWALIGQAARARPNVQFVFVGPFAKMDQRDAPQSPNIHYLGARPYESLPAYLAAFDVGIMPFALNAATQFISPTKTPEYLAAGLPVVSTPIRDVIEPYGRLGLVSIAHDVQEFVSQLDRMIAEGKQAHCAARDAYLVAISWDATWRRMRLLMRDALAAQWAGATHQVAGAEL